MVAEATERVQGTGLAVTFQVGDVYALKLDDAALDACRADRLFHFLRSPLCAMREIARVTKRGGRISVGEPVWDALVVSGGEPALTDAIFAGRRGKQPDIGRALPELFTAAGVQVRHVLPADLMVTDFATARYLFGLVDMANNAEANGAVAPGDADRWLDSLAAAEAAGRLRCILPGFTVAGVR
jgi:SAM-dependent methyltransferase